MPDEKTDRVPPRFAVEVIFILSAGAWALPYACFFLLGFCGCHITQQGIPFYLAGFSALTTAAAVFHLRNRQISLKQLFGVFPHRFQEWKLLLCLIFLLLLSVGIVSLVWKALLDSLGIAYQEQQTLLMHLKEFSVPGRAAIFLSVAVFAPVNEELLFRKLLFDLLLPAGKITACVMTAAVFSAVHLFLFGLPGLFLMSLFFQYIRWKHNSLWSSILLHGFANAAALANALL